METVQWKINFGQGPKVWPEYRKPPAADQLRRRFDLSALRRAAEYDPELGKLLAVLGLEALQSDQAR